MEELNLKDLVEYYLGKIGYIIVIVIIASSLSVIYTTFFKKPMYRSYTTLVLAGTGTESSTDGITQSEVTLNQKLVSTYREIMKSRNVINQVIHNLNLNNTYEYISNNISVTTEKDTELIKITVSNPDATTAKNIADEIANVFSKEIVKIYNIKNVALIDAGEIASRPYNINIIKETIIAALVGFVLGCALIFILYYFDTTIKSPEEIENKLQLPILGSVPDINHLKEEK